MTFPTIVVAFFVVFVLIAVWVKGEAEKNVASFGAALAFGGGAALSGGPFSQIFGNISDMTMLLYSSVVIVGALLLRGVYIDDWNSKNFKENQDTTGFALLKHFGWGTLKQGILTMFLLPIIGPLPAAVVFAAAHYPNKLLTPVTFFAGLISCFIFEGGYGSVIIAGIAHGCLSAIIDGFLPESITGGMRVGRDYRRWRMIAGG